MESIVSGLIRTLATPATKEFTLLWNRKDKMFSLQRDLEMIQAVLSDAEEKEHKDNQVQTWLRHLREVGYDAIDVFDEGTMEVALHPELESEADVGVTRQSVKLVRACFLSCFTDMPNPIVFYHQMAGRIEGIMTSLSDLKKRAELMGLVSRPNLSSNPGETSSWPDKGQLFVGRGEEKQVLIEMLCASDDGVPTLVSLVGMGGVGKTAIAQVVYHDDRIEEHFSFMKKWVFVGKKFDAQKIIEQLLSEDSKQNNDSENRSLENLHTRLISKIKDQNFFIVLDDVWSEKPEEWDSLWKPLKYGAKGSKVLITTRSEVVAMVKGHSSPIIILKHLSDADCWSIFQTIAFGGGNSAGLEIIGLRIVKKLKGLPLAAKLIGGALNRNFTEIYWRRLMDSEIWSQNLEEVGVLPSLLLSYQALPSHLKLCFQFCALFPKDHEFDSKTLVRMWMAHDYVKPIGGERTEDVGSHYFDELLHRSFFQYINDSYVMHDLIHDLAQFVSDGQCLMVEDNKQLGSKQFNRIHHLSLFSQHDLEPEDLHQFNRTRTLLHLHGKLTVASDSILCQLLGRLRCIRVLSLRGCDEITSLPECISNLKHLRYLDLRRTLIKKLPETFCTLYNLQTLMLPRYHDLLPPKGMSKLVNLRNLKAHGNYFSKIAGIGKLTCLQKWKGPFKVSKEKNEGRNMGELKGMNQLGGTLRIENLENVSNVEIAEGFPVKDKVFLHRLELHWERGSEDENSGSSERIIAALQPPQQLKELKLEDHSGSQPPSWMTRDPSLLSYLVGLELYGCQNYTYLPFALARLPCLKSLELVGMSGIKQVGPEFHRCGSGRDVVAFPSLEHLQFRDMAELERWVVDGNGGVVEEGEIEDCNRELGQGDEQRSRRPCRKHPLPCGAFPHLRRLRFERCPKLSTISGLLRHHKLNFLEQLYIRRCEELAQLLGDGEEGGKGKLPLQALDIWGCPKLTWSEVEPLLHAPSSTSLRALRICLDARYHQYESKFIIVLNQKTSLEKEMPLGFVCTNKRELLSRLLQPKRNLLIKPLKYLEVIDCDELTSFTEEEEQEFCGRNLPSLLELSFNNCPKLRSLPAGLESISSLQDLNTKQCSALHSLAVPPMLQRLQIDECPLPASSSSLSSSSSSTETLAQQLKGVDTDNGRLLSWLLLQPRRLEFLQELKISCSQALTDEEEEGWRRNFPFLLKLLFDRCPNLRSLPAGLRHISSLTYLSIKDCPQILALPERGLPPTLPHLTIKKCSALHSLAVPPMLQRLYIYECPRLAKMTWGEMQPDDLISSSNSLPSSSLPSSSSSSTKTPAQQLKVVETDNGRLLSCLLLQPRRLEFLQTLIITGCEDLMTFTEEKEGWRQNLPSLRRLCIDSCPYLRSLPVLPSLEVLQILNCALLEEVMWLEMPSDITVASSNSPPSAPPSSSSMMTPAQLGHVRTNNKRLPSLKYLGISNCPYLCSLPKGLNIKPEIVDCPKLQAPPAHGSLHWSHGLPALRRQH